MTSALEPDCRIYIRGGSSQNNFHVIRYPNKKGLYCEFEQRYIPLPYISSAGTIPNFPRWRIDEDEKCDPDITSLFDEIVYYTRTLEVFPNPVKDWLYLKIPDEYPKGQLVIYDSMGRLMENTGDTPFGSPFHNGQYSVDVSQWGPGVYMAEYLPADDTERAMYVGKVVVQ